MFRIYLPNSFIRITIHIHKSQDIVFYLLFKSNRFKEVFKYIINYTYIHTPTRYNSTTVRGITLLNKKILIHFVSKNMSLKKNNQNNERISWVPIVTPVIILYSS